jgi:ATP-binding cassette subfamily F protein 3
VLEDALTEYTGTICFITHDRHFIQSVADTVLEVSGGTATTYPDGYEYYLEKKARQASASVEAVATAARRVEPPRAEASSKERRRQEAEERTRRSAQTRPLKTRLDALERDLAEKGRDFERLTSLLGDPGFYQDKSRFFSVMEDHVRLQKSIAQLTAEWGELQERYETMVQEADKTA